MIRYFTKTKTLKLLALVWISIATIPASAQSATEKDGLLKRITIQDRVPDGLLAGRSVVLYDEAVTLTELSEIQKGFQATGIDALAYFVVDHMLAGADPQKAFADYLISRNISFLILVERNVTNYTLTFFRFNNKASLAEENTAAWRQTGSILKEVLLSIYRLALSSQKRLNFLINDFPETDLRLTFFSGRRNENYTGQVRTLRVAVPRFGGDSGTALEQLMKDNLPVKYELVDAELSEAELMRKGFGMVLRYTHTRGRLAKEILGYDISQIATSIASVAIVNGEAQLKTIPAEETVYKFYFKHLEYGNYFLGNKWDADPDWKQALINHLTLMKQDLKL